MASRQDATIHLKTSHEQRNIFSGKMRLRGTTMQSFLVDIVEMVNIDEALLDLLEAKRLEFAARRAHHHHT